MLRRSVGETGLAVLHIPRVGLHKTIAAAGRVKRPVRRAWGAGSNGTENSIQRSVVACGRRLAQRPQFPASDLPGSVKA
jgi:hypothetical protein